uniref:Kinesin-like protein n=1 Tax=Poecilia formosa TaxID=48698 RepID=A0A096MGY7_POEFO
IMSSVRVAVRVRPLNKREKRLSSKVIIHMRGNTTSIHKPSAVRGEKLKDRGKMFSYDYCFDSVDADSPTFSSQEKIFKDLGSDVLKAAFDGYNACVFAYGQTGSGKSYTMMGNKLKVDKGLIPRICEGLFLEISNRSGSNGMSFHMEVSSYLEIYNERVQDLLKKRLPYSEGGALKVREHPTDGPYVENLSKHVVLSQSNVESLITLGNATRTIASTGMNDFSSRSHTIFTIIFTQGWFDGELPHERHSKIQLVDLAGSERADGTQAVGTRLKESANINKSLITLNSVISALVSGQSAKKKQIFIPYRNSVLTWLLKDSLGGNTRTTIIATISPADVNYEETLTTLRFARRAKNIINTPTVNEDGSTKVVRELKAEVTRLRSLLAEAAQGALVDAFPSSLEKRISPILQLPMNEVLVVDTSLSLQSNLYNRAGGRQPLLEGVKWSKKQISRFNISPIKLCWQSSNQTFPIIILVLHVSIGSLIFSEEPKVFGIGRALCHLSILCLLVWIFLSNILLYYLKEGKTWIQNEASCCQETVLSGPELPREHCLLENCAGIVTLFPQDGALCSVNGSAVTHPCQLTQGAIIQLGGGPILRFNHPAKASQLKEK